MEPELSLSNAQLKARLTLAAIVVLVLGMAGAALIYAFVEDAAPEAIGYIVGDGLKYPIEPGQSKRYVRELERFGGKASVVFDEFGRWFGGLWQGRNLALTIAVLSISTAAGLMWFASGLQDDND